MSPCRRQGARRSTQIGIKSPPVQANLLGFVHRTDQQADADGEQLHVGQRDTDVPGYDQPFVEDAVENIEQVSCARNGWSVFHALLGRRLTRGFPGLNYPVTT